MTNKLEELKQQKAQIEERIIKEQQRLRDKRLNKEAIKTVCMFCGGTGEMVQGGADILSDPPVEVNCFKCDGRGWRWSLPWRGKKDYRSKIEALFL